MARKPRAVPTEVIFDRRPGMAELQEEMRDEKSVGINILIGETGEVEHV